MDNDLAMLILASESRTRMALLQGAGLRFSTSRAQIDERAIEAEWLGKGAPPAQVASVLAEAKALTVSEHEGDAVVIGGDQVLALDDELLHKPTDIAAAKAQLLRLAGRTHQLHSGIALCRNGTVLWSSVSSAALRMRPFDEAEVEAVLLAEGDAVLGSVGGYRLEGPSIRLFEAIEGDYFTILGLPLLDVLAALRTYAPASMDGFT